MTRSTRLGAPTLATQSRVRRSRPAHASTEATAWSGRHGLVVVGVVSAAAGAVTVLLAPESDGVVRVTAGCCTVVVGVFTVTCLSTVTVAAGCTTVVVLLLVVCRTWMLAAGSGLLVAPSSPRATTAATRPPRASAPTTTPATTHPLECDSGGRLPPTKDSGSEAGGGSGAPASIWSSVMAVSVQRRGGARITR